MTFRQKAWHMTVEALWALLALALPFTSFPLVARLTGSSMVAPAALLPLGALMVLWFLPQLWQGARLPRLILPLLAFAGAGLLSTFLSYFLPLPLFREIPPYRQQIEALATLAMGIGFYLLTTLWTGDPERRRAFLRWVNRSGVILIAAALAQALFWRLNGAYPQWMDALQTWLVTHELYPARASAVAFEPSWLAHQLNMLYLPWWLAASLRNESAHRWRLGFLTFERLLLLGGLASLVVSVSRVGLLALVLMIAALLFGGALRLMAWMQDRLTRRSRAQGFARTFLRAAVGAAIILLVGVLVLGIFAGSAVALRRFDPRMEKFFDIRVLLVKGSFLAYANQLVFAERLIFWQAGWQVFNDHPLFGVGLGNVGYFFPRTLSAFSWNLTEVSTLMYRLNIIPNAKSLWVRLLAETGALGFSCFLVWLILQGWTARQLLASRQALSGTIGLTGLLLLTGLIAEGFSVDTFGLPYYWITLALVSGAAFDKGVES